MRFSIFLILLFCSCTYNELVINCEPDNQVYLDFIKPIIETKCIGCHTELSLSPAILTTYDGVMDAINNHELRNEIISFQMPPYGSTPLSTYEIDIITNWIDCE